MAVMFDSATPTTVILAGVLVDTPNTGCNNFTAGSFSKDAKTGETTYEANIKLGSVTCGFSASWDGSILHGSYNSSNINGEKQDCSFAMKKIN